MIFYCCIFLGLIKLIITSNVGVDNFISEPSDNIENTVVMEVAYLDNFCSVLSIKLVFFLFCRFSCS